MKTLLRFTALLTGVNYAAMQDAQACGFYADAEHDRHFLFFQEFAPLKYAPFYYSADYLNEHAPADYADEQNVALEWNTYLGNKADTGDIYHILFNYKAFEFVNHYQSRYTRKALFENAFLKQLLRQKKYEALAYIFLSKQIEDAFNAYDPWDDKRDVPVENYIAHNGIEKKLLYKLKHTKDAFLRIKYAYQLVKIYRYTNQGAKGVALYEAYLAPLPDKHVLKNWALFHIVNYNYTSGNKGKAAYLLSRIFEHSSHRTHAYRAFVKEDAAGGMAYCRNNHERAVLQAMTLAGNPGKCLPQLANVLRLNAGNDINQLLVTREISKLEEWLLPANLLADKPAEMFWGFYDDNKRMNPANQSYCRDLIAYLDTAANLNASFKLVSRSHLHLLLNEYGQAHSMLKGVYSRSKPLMAQKKLVDLFSLVTLNSISSPKVQQKVLAHLQWFEANKDSFHQGVKTTGCITDHLAHILLRQKQYGYAGLLHRQSVNRAQSYDDWFYISSYYDEIAWFDDKYTGAQVLKAVAVLDKKDKTLFEQYISRNIDVNQLLDLAGTKFINENKLEKAQQAFNRVPDSFWIENGTFEYLFDEDPFTQFYNVEATPTLNVYTKKQFVARLTALQKRNKRRPDAGELIEIGNAYFNMSKFGNTWLMSRYYTSSNARYKEPVDQFIVKAFGYYKQAYAAALNNEQRAKACYQAAYCHQYMFTMDYYNHWDYDDKKYRWHSPYLDIFHRKFRDTEFYSEMSCDRGRAD